MIIKSCMTGLLVAALAATSANAGHMAERPASVSDGMTPHNREAEQIALKVFRSPDLQRVIGQMKAKLVTHRWAQTQSGRATLDAAVDEQAMAAILYVVNSDGQRPQLLWMQTPPRKDWPGARYTVDNPDNFYRITAVDGQSEYRIDGRICASRPAQFSFELLSGWEGAKAENQIAMLTDKDIKTNGDGSFSIMVGPENSTGAANFLKSRSDARMVLIRDTLADWQQESPILLKVDRVKGPPMSPSRDFRALVEAAKREVPRFIEYWITTRPSAPDLTRSQNLAPLMRIGGWGWVVLREFHFQQDQAVLFTVDPAQAKYLGIQIMDPWERSTDYISRSGSLNKAQAQKNVDGSYTFAIAAKDPGLANWLDTEGLVDGTVAIRVQELPRGSANIGGVKDIKVLALKDVSTAVPSDVPRVTPRGRAEQIAARKQSFGLRVSGLNRRCD